MHYMAHYDEAGHLLRALLTVGLALRGEICVHNVHSSVHISQAPRNYESLDSFSAFSYENYLDQLKILQKIVRKISLLPSAPSTGLAPQVSHLQKPQGDEPTPPHFCGKQYKCVWWQAPLSPQTIQIGVFTSLFYLRTWGREWIYYLWKVCNVKRFCNRLLPP